MDGKIKIDYDFISALEGGSLLTGYVPECTPKSVKNKNNRVCYGKEAGSVIGKSGVTIGAGFDLGQHNLYDLQQLELPPDLMLKLIPYLEKKKKNAQVLLISQPLILTESEVALINLKKKQKQAKDLEKDYNKESTVRFADLAGEIQTALFSVTYQYGISGVKTNHKALWLAYTKQEWNKVVQILLGSNLYSNRRRKEAGLIQKVIPNVQVPLGNQ